MTEDHGFNIDPDDDYEIRLCGCKPVPCETFVCAGCKERKPDCSGGADDLCEECWDDEQVDKCGCRAPWCPCDGPKTGYMGE